MSDNVYTTTNATTTSTDDSSGLTRRVTTTKAETAEFVFNSTTYMVSPHPEHGQTLQVTMQGHSMAIPVATVSFQHADRIADTQWETPFSARPPEWQQAILRLVIDHAPSSMQRVVMG